MRKREDIVLSALPSPIEVEVLEHPFLWKCGSSHGFYKRCLYWEATGQSDPLGKTNAKGGRKFAGIPKWLRQQ